MLVYIGLGSNLEGRKQHLIQAVRLLEKHILIRKISPLYETPALLPKLHPPGWNIPFLNAVLEVEVNINLPELFSLTQSVEKEMGRCKTPHKKWPPRKIDIDILSAQGVSINDEGLKVPHPFLAKREFVLSPFRDIAPLFEDPQWGENVLFLSRRLKKKQPSFMDIFNLTPDSFSDGGSLYKGAGEKTNALIEQKIKNNLDHLTGWLDAGGFSTRPGAEAVSEEEEWKRVEPFFQAVKNINCPFTKISVDTFRVSTAKRALAMGVHAVNDVSGLSDPEMMGLLKNSDCDYVLMHSLGAPADKTKTLPLESDPVLEVKNWLEEKLTALQKNNIDLSRIIFDPGIGFGKTAEQSLVLIQRVEEFLKYPVRLLAGHSRKSFMKIFSKHSFSRRDPESIGLSIHLAQKGVDIIRVHNAFEHQRAWLAHQHALPQTAP